ncbi:MAG: BglII/BstYI family type II restriction endonuclease, partial [Stellaceae bacterium]
MIPPRFRAALWHRGCIPERDFQTLRRDGSTIAHPACESGVPAALRQRAAIPVRGQEGRGAPKQIPATWSLETGVRMRQDAPMSTLHLVPEDLRNLYHVHEWRNAAGVLQTACPKEWEDIINILRDFRLCRSEIEASGGNRSPISRRLDSAFYNRGWHEKAFSTAIVVDETRFESPTHKVDCFKGRVALEIEWNNKDPFFDRDLNNFRLLFELRAIDAGIIVTRGSELQRIFNTLGKGKSYGNATTHDEKLVPRLDGG